MFNPKFPNQDPFSFDEDKKPAQRKTNSNLTSKESLLSGLFSKSRSHSSTTNETSRNDHPSSETQVPRVSFGVGTRPPGAEGVSWGRASLRTAVFDLTRVNQVSQVAAASKNKRPRSISRFIQHPLYRKSSLPKVRLNTSNWCCQFQQLYLLLPISPSPQPPRPLSSSPCSSPGARRGAWTNFIPGPGIGGTPGLTPSGVVWALGSGLD
ncbi:hypothetical protein ElyMa_003483600 [Elysia marginata]|uniref:Uncharacterized protein n=1 Tax=Elysia marginata TaxID=1093978 RepID=A0AAV4ECX0_9GAST|nr:hypothetical protein ElyMa_003483600 [Elysia marginata]